MITVSASVGLSPSATRPDDPSKNSICARADQAMYVAKSEYSAYLVFGDDLRRAG